MGEYAWIPGVAALAFTVVVNVRVWWRDRRTDGVAEGKASSETRVDLARIDERLRRAETDITHAVRADLLGPHLAALEARMRAELGDVRAEIRALRRPRED